MDAARGCVTRRHDDAAFGGLRSSPALRENWDLLCPWASPLGDAWVHLSSSQDGAEDQPFDHRDVSR